MQRWLSAGQFGTRRLSLASQFLIAATIVLFLSMAILGTWINRQITRGVLAASGEGGVALINAFLEPATQGLEPGGHLSAESIEMLDQIFVDTPIAKSIVSAKIWSTDGQILYSSLAPEVIGEKHVSNDVARAARGEIVSEFEDMVSAESLHEQALSFSIIEVYAPLFKQGTSNVIAVGEIYENSTALAEQLRLSSIKTWIVVCLTTLVMLFVLYSIVKKGSRKIAAQQVELQRRMSVHQEMASQNEALRFAAERARLEANEANEELIGRIGQDLHDGPIQLLTLLVLRLGTFKLRNSAKGRETVLEMRDLAASVVQELRTLSTGLVLPEIGDISTEDTIRLASYRHENLTGSKVETVIGMLPARVSTAMKICLYRIVQEALNNSFRHAHGAGQRVRAHFINGVLRLEISDAGPGIGSEEGQSPRIAGLGLRGIHNRVQAFGGRVEIRSEPQAGTTVSVTFPATANS
ncbi:sensor histidine kinase [Nitratireductor aquimarinus]|uniref:sensor histidine kinase n=1 Tax=Alphaproteobacteria TaxID=28211 RepID=UPI0019D34BC3|nr:MULTISPECIES: sensor histidine kinase [Alphaproteobacteria]MBN7756648.1 sensor histidine kinase [Nitratireductor aquimarinus]MBY5999735.1 sensor histidine kinase [Tritonibacter mobilis]MBY6021761.1 sensor histidine kinase [Nitratireductor sp. DP7N14-4]